MRRCRAAGGRPSCLAGPAPLPTAAAARAAPLGALAEAALPIPEPLLCPAGSFPLQGHAIAYSLSAAMYTSQTIKAFQETTPHILVPSQATQPFTSDQQKSIRALDSGGSAPTHYALHQLHRKQCAAPLICEAFSWSQAPVRSFCYLKHFDGLQRVKGSLHCIHISACRKHLGPAARRLQVTRRRTVCWGSSWRCGAQSCSACTPARPLASQ